MESAYKAVARNSANVLAGNAQVPTKAENGSEKKSVAALDVAGNAALTSDLSNGGSDSVCVERL